MTTWDIHFAAQPGLLGQSATSTVVGTELVEVPAGKFNAVRVEMVVTAHNGVRLDEPLKYTQWFDPEVGLVKMTGKDGLSRVLKSVTLPDKKDR
jgi:hypothetical protein